MPCCACLLQVFRGVFFRHDAWGGSCYRHSHGSRQSLQTVGSCPPKQAGQLVEARSGLWQLWLAPLSAPAVTAHPLPCDTAPSRSGAVHG